MRNPFRTQETILAPASTRAAFTSSHDAQQLRLIMNLLQRGHKPPAGMSNEMDRLSDLVTRAIRSGALAMTYVPPANGTVTLPVTDDETYLQALMYWCSRLGEPIPRVMEACARAGDGALVRDVQRAIAQIDMEDRTMRTTTLFIEPGKH